MSEESSKFIISRCIMAISLTSILLVSCSNSSNSPVPISSVGSKNNTLNNMLITSLPTGTTNSQNIQSVASSSSSTAFQAIQSAKNVSTSNPIQTRNEHIIYSPKYRNIPKGSYTGGNKYTVKHGDTLFYISWITGNDLQDLAKRNNISAPYSINIGQTLQVGNSANAPSTIDKITSITDMNAKNNDVKSKKKTNTLVSSQTTTQYPQSDDMDKVKTIVTAPTSAPSSNSLITTWCWPTNGKIIRYFSSSEGGNKGIDLTGSKGQAVVATTNGRVVYVGNALRGYGNLIIIKHNDDYLSAYAHNDMIFVREQQIVKIGQKIATMGNTGTSFTHLHFEIRYRGKSVNPLQYLPQR